MAELDVCVVDPKAPKRGKEVLDRLNGRLTGYQPGLQLLPATEVGGQCGDLVTSQVHPAESDSGIGCGRPQHHVHLLAGMQSDSSARDGSAKGLLKGGHSAPPALIAMTLPRAICA
jgi:hypothetical protein